MSVIIDHFKNLDYLSAFEEINPTHNDKWQRREFGLKGHSLASQFTYDIVVVIQKDSLGYFSAYITMAPIMLTDMDEVQNFQDRWQYAIKIMKQMNKKYPGMY